MERKRKEMSLNTGHIWVVLSPMVDEKQPQLISRPLAILKSNAPK